MKHGNFTKKREIRKNRYFLESDNSAGSGRDYQNRLEISPPGPLGCSRTIVQPTTPI